MWGPEDSKRDKGSFFLNPAVWEGGGELRPEVPTLASGPTASQEQLLLSLLPLTGQAGRVRGSGSEQMTPGVHRSNTGWEGEGPKE